MSLRLDKYVGARVITVSGLKIGTTLVSTSMNTGVARFAFTYTGQPFTFAGVLFTYGAPS